MPVPQVAIVGRPNVGKSSLLNALAERLISIVQDMPGVTRDRISTYIPIDGKFVEVIDTGGYGIEDADKLTDHIHQQIDLAMARADVVLFIVDAATGLTPADEEMARLLRKRSLDVVLVANKADNTKLANNVGDFGRLGLGNAIAISALHATNLHELRDAIAARVDLTNAPTEMPEPEMMVAIVGKRNAGKSTLVNAVAETFGQQTDRVIVSEVPGTTRDSVDVRFEKDSQTLIVIDTAGVRKKRLMMANDIEYYSFHRAERSIRRADVVLHLVDGSEPVSEPDKKLAAYIMKQYKPTVLVVNKWDIVKQRIAEQRPEEVSDADLMDEYRQYFEDELRLMGYCPIAFITASESRKVQAVLDLARRMHKQALQRVSTGQLNRALRQILEERQPSTPSGRRAKIYYGTQTAVCPPSIVLFVNKQEYFDQVYRRFIINRFRELLPYAEVPIKLTIRSRRKGGQSLEDKEDHELDELPTDHLGKGKPPKIAASQPTTRSAQGRGTKGEGRGTSRTGGKRGAGGKPGTGRKPGTGGKPRAGAGPTRSSAGKPLKTGGRATSTKGQGRSGARNAAGARKGTGKPRRKS